MAQLRSGVIIIEDDKVALIERVNARGTYYLFPGGGVEAGETSEAAAKRESWEELGVEIELMGLVAVVRFGCSEQHYHLARIVGGIFGSGTGEEFTSTPDSPAGTYRPVWLERSRLQQYNVRPVALAELVVAGSLQAGSALLRIDEQAPHS
ncbi:MAG: NUDIX domain-containing protein [Abitibacteriaceae bacterium]|nr:NUDIX domain-containing protein [Abditibacteriaceae bacterium]MBV9863904.1 NUDIX domain-containing protein [Abditibacteriaceae bacterium]